MKKINKAVLSLILTLALLMSCVVTGFAASAKDDGVLEVGVGRADITGPITDISNGYNSLGDLLEGLLTRLNARAFTVKKGNTYMAYCSVEHCLMAESIKPGVVKELKKRGLNQYGEANTMISVTHDHASSSNISFYGLYDINNGVPGYDKDNYNQIVQGIADAIEKADKDLAPGKVKVGYAKTDIHSYNRSLDAKKWDVNYDPTQFKDDLDAVSNSVNKEMSVISFSHDKDGDIGCIAFFPSHGTSNNIHNHLIASDHKGYASWAVEQKKGKGYICALPQNESADVSPNSPQPQDYHLAFQRASDKDKSLDVIEDQIVPGQEEADWILKILKGGPGITTIDLTPTIDYNYTTVDFKNIKVNKKYIGRYHMPYDDVDNAKTSEPCVGAGMIAGDEEGAPVDYAKEGTIRHDYKLDPTTGKVTVTTPKFADTIDVYGLQNLLDPLWPTAMKVLQSDKYDDEQMEKVVCLAVGKMMQTNQPLQIIRIGEVAIAGVPFELTTEAGRRIKEVLTNTLSKAGVKKVIMSTNTNAYSQYITTREEYAAQHYEGTACFFGPWANSALAQEMDKVAQDIVDGKSTAKGPELATERTILAYIPTYASVAAPKPDTNNPGTLVKNVEKGHYYNGDTVRATFTGAHPRNITLLRLDGRRDLVPEDYSYLYVQKKEGNKWVNVRNDADPYTYIHFDGNGITSTREATINWLLRGVEPGTYRLVYNGVAKDSSTSFRAFTSVSSPFLVN